MRAGEGGEHGLEDDEGNDGDLEDAGGLEVAFAGERLVEGEEEGEGDAGQGRQSEGEPAEDVRDGKGVGVSAVEGVGGESGEGGEVLERLLVLVLQQVPAQARLVLPARSLR